MKAIQIEAFGNPAEVAKAVEDAPRTLLRLFSGENSGRQLLKIADAA